MINAWTEFDVSYLAILHHLIFYRPESPGSIEKVEHSSFPSVIAILILVSWTFDQDGLLGRLQLHTIEGLGTAR